MELNLFIYEACAYLFFVEESDRGNMSHAWETRANQEEGLWLKHKTGCNLHESHVAHTHHHLHPTGTRRQPSPKKLHYPGCITLEVSGLLCNRRSDFWSIFCNGADDDLNSRHSKIHPTGSSGVGGRDTGQGPGYIEVFEIKCMSQLLSAWGMCLLLSCRGPRGRLQTVGSQMYFIKDLLLHLKKKNFTRIKYCTTNKEVLFCKMSDSPLVFQRFTWEKQQQVI